MCGSESSFDDQARLLDQWRDRLLAARKDYEIAGTEAKSAGRDFTSGTVPIPDGGPNMISALRAETRARAEYMRVLRIFTDLVLTGKIPDE